MSDFLSGEALREYLENPLVGQDAIVEGLIFKDTVNIFYSDPGAGKSVIAVNMLASMSGGWDVFGLLKMKRFAKCSYLQLEGSRDEQLGRLKEMLTEIPADFANIAWHTSPLYVESEDSKRLMLEELEGYEPEVIFIDSFYCLTTKGLSSETGFLPVRNLIREIKDRTNATIILLHHSQKPTYTEGKKDIKEEPFLGSQYLKAFADMMVHVSRVSDDKVCLKVTKASRNNEGLKMITLKFNKINWTVKAIEEETTRTATGEILKYLHEAFILGITVDTDLLAKETGYTKRHILRLKKDGHFSPFIEFKDQGHSKPLLWIKKQEKI